MDEKEIIMQLSTEFANITLLEFNEIRNMFKKEYDKITTREMIKLWRDFIYSLNMAEYKRDKIWEYLNGDIDDEYFNHFVTGTHMTWFK